MQIALHKIIPAFFEHHSVAGSGLWLQDIVFNKGEQVHIVAPSGSGKTSLIHFLYALRNDYNGDILFNGKNLRLMDAEALAAWRQQQVSIVFQDLRLFTEQTALQNLEVKNALNPYYPENQMERMAKRLGIENKLTQTCNTLSYGEQQRVAIIRSLLQPFDFLLLDEPFSHLDEANSKKAMELIREEAAARNASVMLADLQQISFFEHTKLLWL